jgi:transcriptional regulator with XRE-family HTH domain
VTEPSEVDDDAYGAMFGRHAKSLRKARKYTQEQLAERSGLAADTIRRLERHEFSPSLNTLRKLATGLDLPLVTLFEAMEVGRPVDPEIRELLELLRTPGLPVRAIIVFLRELIADMRR